MKNNLSTCPYLFRRLELDLIKKGRLCASQWVTTREQLAIFLHQAVTNNSIQIIAERFQRSNETISKAFKAVLNALVHPDFCNPILRLPPTDSI
ncbi:hypothetical protein F5878DRAFT_570768, partial [Lentinula raphanica]